MKKIIKPCPTCGNEFISYIKEAQKYCSYKCRPFSGQGNPNYKGNALQFNCIQCNCKYTIPKNEFDGKKRKGMFCSFNCRVTYSGLHKNQTHTEYESKTNMSISRAIRHSLKTGRAVVWWTKLVGYSIDQLKSHLESGFKDGMTWDNYGVHGWHIEHIIPLTHFRFKSTDDEAFKKCWALDNIQPLWAKDNWAKGNLKNKNKHLYEVHFDRG